MSTVKMTRMFAQWGWMSYCISPENSPIDQAVSLLQSEYENVRRQTFRPSIYFSPQTSWGLRKFVEAERPEALFLHSLRDLWLVYPSLLGHRDVKLFAFARMFLRNVNKKDTLHALLYARLTRLIALSHVQAQELRKCLPISDEQIVVIPNGVPFAKFQLRHRREDLRSEWGVTDEQMLIGLIGRLDPWKGSLEFIRAAAKIHKRHPHTRFVMVGADTIGGGPSIREEAIKLIEDLGLKSVLRLTEHRSDIPDVLGALDIFTMPSYEENFANVLLEAMAAGLPCVSTDAGGTPEILSHGECGLLVQPRSDEALAHGICHLLDHPDKRRLLSEKARLKAEAEYDLDKVFQRIVHLLEPTCAAQTQPQMDMVL